MTSPTSVPNPADTATTAGKLEDLRQRLAETAAPVGEGAVAAVHEAGRLTARERVEQLLDPGSFVEIDALARHRSTFYNLDRSRPVSDGVVTGYGTVDGRQVCVFSQDGTVFDGTVGEVHAEKLTKVMELAGRSGVPLVGIHDSTGARVGEGVVSLGMAARLYKLRAELSGVVPQISVIAGPTAGTAAHQPVLADIVVMVEGASLYLTDAATTERIVGEAVSAEELGSAAVHAGRTGTSHHTAADDTQALGFVRDALAHLPSNNRSVVPEVPAESADSAATAATALDTLVPDSPLAGYDMTEAITGIVDPGSLLELQPEFAGNVVTAFARVEGRAVGVIATQPLVLAGALDTAASEKAARFVRTCDAFNIPLLFLVDSPGFLPGTAEEHNGLLRRSSVLLYAVAEATVGMITVVTRKAFGTSYIALGSKNIGADLVFAWPSAQISHADAENTVALVHADALAKAKRRKKDVAALTAEFTEEIERTQVNPYAAAERGYVDAVITPNDTRRQVADGLGLLERKVVDSPARKHGNPAL
ncbi:MAG: acyl-CoA carboxylase subunit beta [Corynebacterium sp.]|uniref:acyl-CoA carboxylase subunit beta n=1 Tax=Corynebacterium TaxID=1716 RepID=UPI002649B689|nr:acyl-CoA carboxylase subunit beta [Corynebacterium sp.]MDN5722612.1 acyl-CoA carboxylase subunit beta [Corynebacterium sp.]MDN6282196.1 acyl-CoA carboxylase subunit beta [Corynebacterium sp.]MDN6306122.1 acyl-CoA carboxylase subunit beta [Corynebacterium sp.]MDN6366826.1 acyl-CoA carboxylase subunit beta [Corynebacterium sp.]MDN6375817.1 acyl-CoA carboxylase subunit beta [Corynebacterium sp.]